MQHLSLPAVSHTEGCWQKASFQCVFQLGRALQKHCSPIRWQGGDLLTPVPHFSKQGRDWMWTINEPRTQRSANKLIRHSWEWWVQQSAETRQTPWPLRGMLCFSQLTCQSSPAAPGADAMSVRCFPWAGKAVLARGDKDRVLLCGVVSPTLVFAVLWLDVSVCVWPCWWLSRCPWEKIQNH